MKKLFQLMLIVGTVAAINSCNQPDACEDTTCLNGGTCVDGDCACPVGFSGEFCQVNDSIPCEGVNCLNGGICADGSCDCPEGFYGPSCEFSAFTNGVFVVHEGNFQGGNATLSFFNRSTNEMSNGVFASANSIPLGDVGQSMTIIGNNGYIVVNNSGKIEVVNLQDLGSVGTITGLTSPRFIAEVSSSKAYVSDLYAGVITEFNPQTLAATGTIPVVGQVEEMVSTSSGVIAAGTGANQVYRINTSTNTFSDSVTVGIGPNNLAVDANGKVWVLTNGGWGTEQPKLVRINPTDMSIELSLDFTLSDYPASLKTNASGTALYWVNGGVFKMDITATAVPTGAFLNANAYKVGVDPSTDQLYVADAGDFNSNGTVYRYQADGTLIDMYTVGVIPGEFCFTE